MTVRMQTQTTVGYALTAIGVAGVFVSFAIQQSDIDPTAFSLAM